MSLPSTDQYERAQDLLAGHRVLLNGKWIANCASDSGGNYTIIASADGCSCDCPARVPECAHVLAALVLWHERDQRERGDDALRREVFG